MTMPDKDVLNTIWQGSLIRWMPFIKGIMHFLMKMAMVPDMGLGILGYLTGTLILLQKWKGFLMFWDF